MCHSFNHDAGVPPEDYLRDLVVDEFTFVYAGLALPNLPPAAVVQEGGERPLVQKPRSPISPAFSSSSTADGKSSPVLPSLSAPTLGRKALDLLKTPPSVPRTDRSQYYTASWGSPYEHSSQSRAKAPDHQSSESELSEDSPIQHIQFHTPYLRPVPTFSETLEDPGAVSQSGLSAAVLLNRIRRPAHGLTEDWIRQHTAGESETEHHNWFSSDEEEDGNSLLSGSVIADGEENSEIGLESTTPTVRRILEQRDRATIDRRHHRGLSSQTLRALDFEPSAMAGNSNTSGFDAEVLSPLSALDDKPLPMPPPEVPRKESSLVPEWRASALRVSADPLPDPATVVEPITESPSPPTQRLKKKVAYKGKNLTVLLPTDENRGKPGHGPVPMKPNEVARMLNEWDNLGYDTTGFVLGHSTDNPEFQYSTGQSRDSWPDSQDVREDREKRHFNVSIPDRKQWDTYVEELQEAKLRALLGSLGEKEAAAPSPAPPIMSRQTSMQYPALPFSPPIPTSSAASSHVTQHNPFSPYLAHGVSSTGQSSNVGSIASPASMHAHLHGKYPRQSISMASGEHPFGSPFQYPQQPSPSVWSPQQMLNQQGVARGGSPSYQALAPLISPAPSFGHDLYNYSSPTNSQQQQHFQPQFHQQIPQHNYFDVPEQSERDANVEENQSKSPSKTPEARPSGHNPSASLQQEIDDAEYHLEEQIQRELEHEDYSPHSDKADPIASLGAKSDELPVEVNVQNKPAPTGLAASRFAATPEEEKGPILHHPQPHSRGHSLSQRPFKDDDEVSTPEIDNAGVRKSTEKDNPAHPNGTSKDSSATANTLEKASGSTTGHADESPANESPANKQHNRSISIASNPWADVESSTTVAAGTGRRTSHSSKASLSKLNVAAKEFKFDPANTFKPSQFNFSGSNSFQPAFNASASPFSPHPASVSHLSQASVDSLDSFGSRINAAAPSFKPGQTDFSFSGPTFRPDAPEFTPSKPLFGESLGSVRSGSEGPPSNQSSIFGNIDMTKTGVIKSSKKSKAVPIIRPDSRPNAAKAAEEEFVEDKEGRIGQAEGRNKRARATGNDGNSIPQFAEPSNHLQITTREQSPRKDYAAESVKVVDKENVVPPAVAMEDLVDLGEQASTDDEKPVIAQSDIRHISELMKATEVEQDVEPVSANEDLISAPSPPAAELSHDRGSTLDNVDEIVAKDLLPENEEVESSVEADKHILSATAPSFEVNHSHQQREEEKPERPDIIAPKPASVLAQPAAKGLAASRYAFSPSPPPAKDSPDEGFSAREASSFQASLPQPESPPTTSKSFGFGPSADREPTFEEIDAVMRHLTQNDSDLAAGLENSPAKRITLPDPQQSSPIRLQPQNLMRSDAPSPSPRRYQAPSPEASPERIFSRGLHDDPFIGQGHSGLGFAPPIHHLNTAKSQPASDWDDVLSEAEESKLQQRTGFFDNHVNDIVGGLLTEKLGPLGEILMAIQSSLDNANGLAPSGRRERRSVSPELRESDADDEDDEHDIPRRSMSPRKDRKYDKLRSIVSEALASHQFTAPIQPERQVEIHEKEDFSTILSAVEDIKEQFAHSMHLDFRGEDLKNIVEEAVEKRMPAPKLSQEDSDAATIKILDLQSRLQHTTERVDLAEAKAEEASNGRRAAEDRLAEIQRLLRISSEEENRLRESVDEKEERLKGALEAQAKAVTQAALLEAAQGNSQKIQSDLTGRLNMVENDILESQRIASHWQLEAERALHAAQRHSDDAEQANETNRHLASTVERLKTQMEESIRTRESMRGKFSDLQDDMARAAQMITEENARRAKREQELVARQEVLDARLQAEARTRERLEMEIERLEGGERQGMRAVSDCKKLEALVAKLQTEIHDVHQSALRYKREFEDARESGLNEAQRIKTYMQSQVDTANNQVNIVRNDLEFQLARSRGDIDQIKLESDTVKAKHDMLLEEATESKAKEVAQMTSRNANEIEDLQTKHERDLGNALEDAQRSEQHLLERLSLSSSKTEHLQDRVTHLEEKLEIAQAAAEAAAKAARSASITMPPTADASEATSSKSLLPEKISPQALRESILVLQEQLQDREHTIEKLEQQLSTVDLEAPSKISKRDDEIVWLRELLSVRKGDLQDIVSNLSGEEYNAEAVRDAAIRLKANLQMEEQERERALNGGSSIPNIAATLKDAATPRVAQAVGPLAAAWGSWRKARESSFTGISTAAAGETVSASTESTPSKARASSQSFLSGLMTPPASSARQTPLLERSVSGSSVSTSRRGNQQQQQPTAFGSTGQRFTAEQLANRPRRPGALPRRGGGGDYNAASTSTTTSATATNNATTNAAAAPGDEEPAGPKTPPMMRKSSYDEDALARASVAGDDSFSDVGVYDDDESIYGGASGSAAA